MKRWFKIIPDENSSIDYAVINNSTGEKEAIIARNCGHGGSERYIRFVRNPGNGNCWEAALYHRYFPNLKEVSRYYDCVNH